MAEPLSPEQTAAVLAEISQAARAVIQVGMLLEPDSDVDREDRAALAYFAQVLGQRVGWLADAGMVPCGGFTAEEWMFPPLTKRSGVQS